MKPSDIGPLSLWQFASYVNGWIAANTPDDGSLDTEEIDELWELINDAH
jgi:hypothetical protein